MDFVTIVWATVSLALLVFLIGGIAFFFRIAQPKKYNYEILDYDHDWLIKNCVVPVDDYGVPMPELPEPDETYELVKYHYSSVLQYRPIRRPDGDFKMYYFTLKETE